MSGSILPIKMVTLTTLSLLFPTTIVPKSTVFHSQWVHEVRHLHLFTCERDARFTYTCSIWIAMGGFLRLRADCTCWQRWCSQIATIKTAYVIKWTATHWQQHYKIQQWPTISLNINNGKSPEKKTYHLSPIWNWQSNLALSDNIISKSVSSHIQKVDASLTVLYYCHIFPIIFWATKTKAK